MRKNASRIDLRYRSVSISSLRIFGSRLINSRPSEVEDSIFNDFGYRARSGSETTFWRSSYGSRLSSELLVFLCSRIASAESPWMRLHVSTKDSKYKGDTWAMIGSSSSFGRSLRVGMVRFVRG